MIEFEFDTPAWELALGKVKNGTSLSAVWFLTLMEQESEEDFEDALQLLSDKDILLDTADLPAVSSAGATAVRLRREKQLVQEGKLPGGLEENDPLRLYLEELAAIPVCGDVNVLAQELLAGNSAAQAKLMDLMLSRVLESACALAGHSVLLMDLIQEGSMGLWQGILSYSGDDIEAWCGRAIQIAMARAVVIQARENGVGQKLRQALEDYRAVDERLLSELGRNPTMEEISQELHLTLEETETVAQMLDTARTVSQAKQAAEPKEETPDDEAAVEDTAYFQMRQRITDLLSVLDETDAQLVTLRYGLEGGLPLSPEDTGRKLGLTPEEVVARETAALSKLRNH